MINYTKIATNIILGYLHEMIIQTKLTIIKNKLIKFSIYILTSYLSLLTKCPPIYIKSETALPINRTLT